MDNAWRPDCSSPRPRITGSPHQGACTVFGDREATTEHVLEMLPEGPLREMLLSLLAARAATA
jgi:hypothetical protein